MPTQMINLIGKLADIKPEDARRIAVYLVRGNEVLAHAKVQDDGNVHISLSRQALAAPSAYGLEAVIGPAGMAQNLKHVPNLQRVPLDLEQLQKAKAEHRLHLEKIRLSEELLKIWWIWCQWYCVNGTVVGPDGCPVPFAEVTVYSVAYTSGGFTKTPQATVSTDVNGQFSACFIWCSCFFCCWPCWPFWWFCWPWWWEWDILRVIEDIERRIPPVPPNPLSQFATQTSFALNRPAARDLMRGQGFAFTRQLDAKFAPDPDRTALIQSKFSNASIRALFPWWWWCCDDPNIIFGVTQGPNTIVDENPAIDTRWCLEDGSTVTLIANGALSVCPGDPKPLQGFVWTRVGNITVDHIHDGYADGSTGTDTSDMAFAGSLDINGEFAASSSVAYYQVNAGQWSGDPSRGGTAPTSSIPISADLYNHVFILHTDLSVTSADVKMGPFNNAGVINLYATQEQRPNVPSGLLPPFPTLNPGDLVFWAFNGRKVNTDASNLIGGGNVGGVDLTVTAYDSTFALLSLPSNPDDILTLEVDTTNLTATINSFRAFRSDNTEVFSTGTGACPAYQIGSGGYVKLNVTVTDANGHLFEYVLSPEFGSGSSGTTTPGLRGYSQAPGTFPAGYSGPPNTAQKSFVGGTEDITYSPPENCCYDFRLNVGKRVTNGEFFPSLFTAAFQTATINVS